MSDEAQVALLRDPATIRDRAHALLALAEADALPYLRFVPARIDAAAGEVVAAIREAYPSLDIPWHARWRHFSAGGVDRWGALAEAVGLDAGDPAEALRARVDLCVVSVLLDAGAGPDWRYVERGGAAPLARSEGLAVASLDAFRAGLFSADPARRPLRADADALAALDARALGEAFQVTPSNPLEGLEGRVALLRALGRALRDRADLFGATEPRVGHLADHLRAGPATRGGALPAREILAALLDGFSPIWPGRIVLGGANLGDVWRHPLAAPDGPAPGLVPFHKLSQWLAYSLAEAFHVSGVPVGGLDDLTGLPEYRNGGLLLDTGVLALRDPALAEATLAVGHEAVVEWRALTVALLDRLAVLVRARLARTPEQMPLACVLEGGTWAAGRRIAARLRPGGPPPLRVASDGTVF